MANTKNITTVAMLVGAVSTENQLEENLRKMMQDLATKFTNSSLTVNKQKIKRLEYRIKRDKQAIDILHKVIMTGINMNLKKVPHFEVTLFSSIRNKQKK